jgi:predicted transcriptional regulator
MVATTLDNEINKCLPLLDAEEKQSILAVIKSFLSHRNSDAEIDRVQYTKEIDEAMARIDAGEYTTFEDLEKEMDTW